MRSSRAYLPRNSAEMQRMRAEKIIPEPVIFGGGLDTVTPPLALPPGFLRDGLNVECDVNGGYARVLGYERYSGQPSPSAATYAILTATITGAPALGNTLTGATSGASGVIIALPGGSFVLTKVSGTYVNGENLNVGGPTIATAIGAQVVGSASTLKLDATYKALAATQYRNNIAAVPGSGSVLGVWIYNELAYAIRNNVGATAAVLYKESGSGWGAVALGRELKFSTGNLALAEGVTLTGATSAATAVVTRVRLESGSYGATTAAGGFIFASVTGAFVNGENLQTGGITRAVAVGGDTAITLAPGGKYEFVNSNFGGASNTARMYGCGGVSRAFEFDGTVFVPINTGMSPDTPTHIGVHKNQLHLSFKGSSQNSSPGLPYQWTPITGAAEIALGYDITGYQPQAGAQASGALTIFTQRRMAHLYGNGSSDWNLIPYDFDLGASPYTIQHVSDTVFLDNRGLTTLQRTQSFGNFEDAMISRRIRTWLATEKNKAIASCIVRDKNQYRVFFSDGYALFVTFDGARVLGMTPVLFPNSVNVAASWQMNDSSEKILIGCTNGFVYQLEKGTSFDGVAINWYMNLAFNNSRSPRQDKRYRQCMLEVAGSGYAEFNFSYQLGYNSSEIPQVGIPQMLIASVTNVPLWDSFTWDAFIWDGQNLVPALVDMEGDAENVSLVLQGSSDSWAALRFSGAVIHYSPRRLLR